MKTTIFLLLISVFILISCEKAKYENTGIITGADLADCACCGGYFIEIGDSIYRFQKDKLPGNFTFDDKQLPIQVDIDWERKTDICPDFNWITIQKVKN